MSLLAISHELPYPLQAVEILALRRRDLCFWASKNFGYDQQFWENFFMSPWSAAENFYTFYAAETLEDHKATAQDGFSDPAEIAVLEALVAMGLSEFEIIA